MKQSYQPAVVVIAFNRLHSLKRILHSLDLATYAADTRLIISIDNDGRNSGVVKLADEFNWHHGEKEIIYHSEHLGLRNHVFACGDLAYKYGSVILLEEDLVVSPFFYQYAKLALEYYDEFNEVSGISLYSLPYTEAAKIPFQPIKDNSDVFFMQIPSSLGLAISQDHWDSFKKWYSIGKDLNTIPGLPTIVTKYWSKSSWKKFYYGYMIENDKYTVYPFLSLTSNFNDRGENMFAKSYTGQVNLQMVEKKYVFKSINESISVYDAYSEILQDRLKLLCPSLQNFDFDIDLFGQKEFFTRDYVITVKPCRECIRKFDRAMKPIELNIVNDIPGNKLKLAKKNDVISSTKAINDLILKSLAMEDFIENFEYFYTNMFDIKVLLKILKHRIKIKLQNMLGFGKK